MKPSGLDTATHTAMSRSSIHCGLDRKIRVLITGDIQETGSTNGPRAVVADTNLTDCIYTRRDVANRAEGGIKSMKSAPLKRLITLNHQAVLSAEHTRWVSHLIMVCTLKFLFSLSSS